MGISSNEYTIYVKDLPLDAKEEDLLRVFEQVDYVERIHLYRDSASGGSLGRALVVYECGTDPNPVDKALVELRDKKINGERFTMTRFHSQRSANDGGTLFIGFLGGGVDDRRLREMFAPFGANVFCSVDTKAFYRRRCCGQVHFEKASEAAEALEMMNGWMDKNGKKLQVEWFDAGKHSYATKRIFVKHLPAAVVDERTLAAMFRRFGGITEAEVCYNELGLPHGFGFVTFENTDSASEAISQMNGIHVAGKRLVVQRSRRKST